MQTFEKGKYENYFDIKWYVSDIGGIFGTKRVRLSWGYYISRFKGRVSVLTYSNYTLCKSVSKMASMFIQTYKSRYLLKGTFRHMENLYFSRTSLTGNRWDRYFFELSKVCRNRCFKDIFILLKNTFYAMYDAYKIFKIQNICQCIPSVQTWVEISNLCSSYTVVWANRVWGKA